MSEFAETSVDWKGGAGETRRFSSFGDLLRSESWDGLLARRPARIHDLIFEWYRQGQIACQYAVKLALDPADSRWASELVMPGFDVGALNERIDRLTPACEAIQLVFAGVATPVEVSRLVKTLCESGRWECYETAWDYEETGDCLPLALRWNDREKRYTSWVLGIAPFETMPFTRRFVGAPFTVLVLRTAQPGKEWPRYDEFLTRDAAHLAQMDDRCGRNKALRRELTNGTERERKRLLANDDKSVGRGRVTFGLPESYRAMLTTVLLGTDIPEKERKKLKKLKEPKGR